MATTARTEPAARAGARYLPFADGPSIVERARRLAAAYEASTRDDGQRQLLAEIMAHYRAWCVSRSLGDPFDA